MVVSTYNDLVTMECNTKHWMLNFNVKIIDGSVDVWDILFKKEEEDFSSSLTVNSIRNITIEDLKI